MEITREALAKMSSDEYRQKFQDPEFRAAVDKLEESRPVTSVAPVQDARARAQQAESQAFVDAEPAAVVETPVAVPEPVVQAAITVPIVDTPATVAVSATELPEKLHRYQPKDELGRPSGGEQVIKYRTMEELVQKLTENHSRSTVELKKRTREQSVANVTANDVPDDARKFKGFVDFKPRVLSADERVALARDLQNPETAPEAQAKIFEAELGASPKTIAEFLDNTQTRLFEQQCLTALESFKASTPGYFRCNDNAEAIIGWVNNRNLDPTDPKNFKRAYDALETVNALIKSATSTAEVAGLATEAPIVREETPKPVTAPVETLVNTLPVQAEPSRIAAVTPAPEQRPVPPVATGLTRKSASEGETIEQKRASDLYVVTRPKLFNGKPTGQIETLKGVQAIEATPSDELKKRINRDKGFRQLVDAIWAEHDEDVRKAREARA